MSLSSKLKDNDEKREQTFPFCNSSRECELHSMIKEFCWYGLNINEERILNFWNLECHCIRYSPTRNALQSGKLFFLHLQNSELRLRDRGAWIWMRTELQKKTDDDLTWRRKRLKISTLLQLLTIFIPFSFNSNTESCKMKKNQGNGNGKVKRSWEIIEFWEFKRVRWQCEHRTSWETMRFLWVYKQW